MRKILPPAVLTAALTCAGLMAQSTPSTTPQNVPAQSPTTQAPMPTPSGAPPAANPNQPRIAPGSVIPVQLTKTVDAKKAKTGDEVVAKVTQDMKTQTGQVLVPKDTKVIGHVTEAQARHKDEKESQLAIAFNEAVLNNQQVQIPMSIQAVIGQENNDNANPGAGGGAPAASSPAPSNTGTGASSPMGSRSPNAGTGETQPPTGPPSGNDQAQTSGSKRPPINGQTQGVIGLSNVTLAPAQNGQQGSLLTSEKNNVKLESGTMLLLKVSQ